jgi:hypothetical protein
MATSYTITKRAEWLHGLSIDELDLREADEVDSEFVIQRRNINPFLIDLERRQMVRSLHAIPGRHGHRTWRIRTRGEPISGTHGGSGSVRSPAPFPSRLRIQPRLPS